MAVGIRHFKNALILVANVYIDFETHHLNKRPASAVWTSICKSTVLKDNAETGRKAFHNFIYHETQHSPSSQNVLAQPF